MKKFQVFTLAIALLLLISSVFAQRSDKSTEVKEAMAKLSILTGEWSGSGWMMSMKMEKENSTVSEKFSWKLDNTVLLIEGIGKDDSGKVVHNALATVFYDANEKQYKMNSHLADGNWTEALFEIVEENAKFKWTIDSHGATIVYEITIAENKWFEEGFYSRPTMDEPMKFFEMNLEKK